MVTFFFKYRTVSVWQMYPCIILVIQWNPFNTKSVGPHGSVCVISCSLHTKLMQRDIESLNIIRFCVHRIYIDEVQLYTLSKLNLFKKYPFL